MDVLEEKGAFRMAADATLDRHDWGTTSFACGPAIGARQLAVLEAVFDPGGGHSFHMHPEQEELLYVVSGRIEQWIDRERRVLGPGDSAFLPPGVVHASFNASDGQSWVLAIFGPCVGDGLNIVELGDQAPWRSLRG